MADEAIGPNIQLYIMDAEKTLEDIVKLIRTKSIEYARNDNPFHVFDEGARQKNIVRERIIEMFSLKHEISINDIIRDFEKTGELPSLNMINEKFDDAILYLIIKKLSLLDGKSKSSTIQI